MKIRELIYSKYYLRSFFSIIVLMVLFLGAVALFFWNTNLSHQRETVEREAAQSVQKAKDLLSEKLEEMLHIVLEIGADNSFTFAPVMGGTQAERHIIQKTLDRYVSCNAFISDISYESILDTENIFSSQGRYSKKMYARYVYAISGLDAERFAAQQGKQTVNTIPAWNLTPIVNPTPKLAFVYSLPIASSQPKGYVTFYIESSAMNALFKTTLAAEFDNVYLLENDRLVYAYCGNEAETVGLDGMYSGAAYSGGDGFVYLQDAYLVNNWRFIARWDAQVLYREFNSNRLFFTILLLSALLVIILSSAMVALRNYAPLGHVLAKYHALMQKGMPPSLRKDDLLALETFVDDEIDKRQRLARQLFLSNLIWNQYEDSDTIYSAADEAGLIFAYPAFICCALLYHMEGKEEHPEDWTAHIEDALDEANSVCYGTQIYGQSMLFFIINLEDEQVDFAAFEATLTACLTWPGIRAASLGLSSVRRKPTEVPQQYQEAAHAAREGFLLGQAVTRIELIEHISEHPQFSAAKRRIGDALRRGDEGKAQAAWETLEKVIAADDSLTSRKRYVAYRLLDSLVNQFVGSLPVESQSEMETYQTLLMTPSAQADYAQAVRSLIVTVARAQQGDAHTKEDALLARIQRYIDAHYCDDGLSLDQIATECRITSSYLVRYFKSKTNDTPMQYVDSLRMQRARQLLATTSCSLSEVTHLSGYLSESNFARKFKKLYACTPMHYRRACQNGEENGGKSD